MRNRQSQKNAKVLRRRMTDAEQLLWSRLRRRQLSGYKFRRQHPIGHHIVDFACIDTGLATELDGGQHNDNKEHDAARTQALNAKGFRVLRFWNHQVLTETEAVLEVISKALNPHLNPPPRAGEEV